MKITYTSDDVKHWDTEAECLGREPFQALLEADRYVHEPGDDPETGLISTALWIGLCRFGRVSNTPSLCTTSGPNDGICTESLVC